MLNFLSIGDDFNYELLYSFDMMKMDEFDDWKEETRQELKEGQSEDQEGHHHVDCKTEKSGGQDAESETKKAQKLEVFNQMMNLKSMIGKYTLITKK